jgi:hypothetical protein
LEIAVRVVAIPGGEVAELGEVATSADGGVERIRRSKGTAAGERKGRSTARFVAASTGKGRGGSGGNGYAGRRNTGRESICTGSRTVVISGTAGGGWGTEASTSVLPHSTGVAGGDVAANNIATGRDWGGGWDGGDGRGGSGGGGFGGGSDVKTTVKSFGTID